MCLLCFYLFTDIFFCYFLLCAIYQCWYRWSRRAGWMTWPLRESRSCAASTSSIVTCCPILVRLQVCIILFFCVVICRGAITSRMLSIELFSFRRKCLHRAPFVGFIITVAIIYIVQGSVWRRRTTMVPLVKLIRCSEHSSTRYCASPLCAYDSFLLLFGTIVWIAATLL